MIEGTRSHRAWKCLRIDDHNHNIQVDKSLNVLARAIIPFYSSSYATFLKQYGAVIVYCFLAFLATTLIIAQGGIRGRTPMLKSEWKTQYTPLTVHKTSGETGKINDASSIQQAASSIFSIFR